MPIKKGGEIINYQKEKIKWQKYKEAEDKILKENHTDKAVMDELYAYDWKLFKKERIYQMHHLNKDTAYFDMEAAKEYSVANSPEELLRQIENEQLYRLLKEDKHLLNIVFLKMSGYDYQKIAELYHVSYHEIFYVIRKFKKKYYSIYKK